MARGIFHELFDDASLFPPASLGMADALAGHLRHTAAWYREMCGPFVCADTKITQLSTALTAANVAELDLALVLPAGVGGLYAAVEAVFADPRLRLRAVEVPTSQPVAGQPVAGQPGAGAVVAFALTARLDAIPLAGAAAFIEIPVAEIAADCVRVVAEHRYLIKLRTGGVTAEAFPDEQTLARCLVTLAQERVPFKSTAGLHHAVRHRAADTGFEHHGFLNVLLAVATAVTGAGMADVAAVLADQDPARVAAAVNDLDAEAAAEARSLFTSFGTCSTDEPITDLVRLGLVSSG